MADVKLQITREDDTTYDIDNRTGLKSVESLSQSTNSPEEIIYGILSNTGSADILDVNGAIYEQINNGTYNTTGKVIKLIANNNEVQRHTIIDNKYNIQGKTLTISLSDDLQKLKDYTSQFDKFTSETSLQGIKTIRDVLENILTQAGFIEYPFIENLQKFLSNYIIIDEYGQITAHYETIFDYLGKIKIIDYAYYKETASFYEIIDKICKATQLYAFQNDEGKLEISSARPIIFNNQQIIDIPTKNQFSIFDENIFIKNKYNNVKYDARKQNITIKEIGSFNYSLQDNNIWSLKNIPEASIQTFNGQDYLCFFVTTNTTGNYSATSLTLDNDNLYSATISLITGQTISYSTSAPYIIDASSTVTKNNYDFSTATIRRLPYYSTLTSDVYAIALPIDNRNYTNVSVSIMGRLSETLSEERLFSQSGDNIYNYEYKNEFIGDKTRYYKDTTSTWQCLLQNYIANTIINDYSNGIRSATITISCDNYYNINGGLVKDWQLGEKIKVGDIVKVDKDNEGNSISSYSDGTPRLWKVVGRKFRKGGVPYIDLVLQEVKKSTLEIPNGFATLFINGTNDASTIRQYAGDIVFKRIKSGGNGESGVLSDYFGYFPESSIVVTEGDIISMYIRPRFSNYNITSFTIGNGTEYNNGEEIKITSDMFRNNRLDFSCQIS